MEEKLIKIIQDIFGNPNLKINENTIATDVDGWDSFNHMNLVMAIEDQFSISFTTKEIGQMARVGDLFSLVKTKLN